MCGYTAAGRTVSTPLSWARGRGRGPRRTWKEFRSSKGPSRRSRSVRATRHSPTAHPSPRRYHRHGCRAHSQRMRRTAPARVRARAGGARPLVLHVVLPHQVAGPAARRRSVTKRLARGRRQRPSAQSSESGCEEDRNGTVSTSLTSIHAPTEPSVSPGYEDLGEAALPSAVQTPRRRRWSRRPPRPRPREIAFRSEASSVARTPPVGVVQDSHDREVGPAGLGHRAGPAGHSSSTSSA